MTFEEARALFPVLERLAYLNAGTFGPLARPTSDAVAEQLRRDLERGRSGKAYIDEAVAARSRVRDLVADLVGATPEHVSLTSSTTDGCNIVLSGLGLEPEDEIVTTDSEHFGLAGPVFASGATVRVARVQELGPDEALEAIVAEVTPRTRLLAVSHVLWTTGIVLDVHALKERTGLPIVVDGAQSVGAIPVEVGALDYYTVSGQKWLCGPESTGALYVADVEALRVARPAYWAQESFEPGGRYVPRAGAQRFDPGWIPVASLKGLATALDLAPDWRYDRIGEMAGAVPRGAGRARAGRDAAGPGGARDVRDGRRPGADRREAVRAGHRPSQPARHAVAPRLVRLVDERGGRHTPGRAVPLRQSTAAYHSTRRRRTASPARSPRAATSDADSPVTLRHLALVRRSHGRRTGGPAPTPACRTCAGRARPRSAGARRRRSRCARPARLRAPRRPCRPRRGARRRRTTAA